MTSKLDISVEDDVALSVKKNRNIQDKKFGVRCAIRPYTMKLEDMFTPSGSAQSANNFMIEHNGSMITKASSNQRNDV